MLSFGRAKRLLNKQTKLEISSRFKSKKETTILMSSKFKIQKSIYAKTCRKVCKIMFLKVRQKFGGYALLRKRLEKKKAAASRTCIENFLNLNEPPMQVRRARFIALAFV